MSPHARPLAADDARARVELARALRQIRPTLILVCELGAVRVVAPTLRADLVQIVDRVTHYLEAAPASDNAPPCPKCIREGVRVRAIAADRLPPGAWKCPECGAVWRDVEFAPPAAAAPGGVELTWHIYAEGKTECGELQGPPHTWPVGHVWVRKSRASDVPVARRCAGCWK